MVSRFDSGRQRCGLVTWYMMTTTKYSVDDDYWTREESTPAKKGRPTTVESHTVDVILTIDPTKDMGYGRKKYTVHIFHTNADSPVALYAMQHRWKGNFWQKHKQIDWCDVPLPVKCRVEQIVACNGIDDLDPGHRLIGEGGRDPWTRNGDENE